MIKSKNGRIELTGDKQSLFKDACNVIIALSDLWDMDVAEVGCDVVNAVINYQGATRKETYDYRRKN